MLTGSGHTVEYLCSESQHQSWEKRSRLFPGEEGRGDLVGRPTLGGEETGHLGTVPAGSRHRPNPVQSSYDEGRQEKTREVEKRDLLLLPQSHTDKDGMKRRGHYIKGHKSILSDTTLSYMVDKHNGGLFPSSVEGRSIPLPDGVAAEPKG